MNKSTTNFKFKKTAIIIGGGRMGQVYISCLKALKIKLLFVIEKSLKKKKELKNKFLIDEKIILNSLNYSKLSTKPDLIIISTGLADTMSMNSSNLDNFDNDSRSSRNTLSQG